LVYSSVSIQDIEKSAATPHDLDEIIFEMIQQLSFAKTFVFFAEAGTHTTVYASSTGLTDLSFALASYKPTMLGTQTMKLTVPKPILEAQTEILAVLAAASAQV
jgi:hypothetical protein